MIDRPAAVLLSFRHAWCAMVVVSLLILSAGCSSSAVQGRCGDADWTPPGAELSRSIALPAVGGTASGRSGARAAAPMIILPFDREGHQCDPDARRELQALLKDRQYSDIYLLCPGWNDGWHSSIAWMTALATGYEQARIWAAPDDRRTGDYNPLYVGILWPGSVLNRAYPARGASTRTVALRPDVDRTALLNVLNTDPAEPVIARIQQALIDRGHQRRSIDLAELLEIGDELTPPQLIELTDCLLPLFGPQAEPSAPGMRYALTAGRDPGVRAPQPLRAGLLATVPTPLPPMTAAELLDVWKDAVRTASATIPRPTGEPTDDASLARRGGLSVSELVRWALHATDLRVMKDRAYRVGRSAVAGVLSELRQESTAEVHVVAHSFGAEVVLAALTKSVSRGATAPPAADAAPAATQPRPLVDTLLLLSPLVNAYAIADPPLVGKDVLPSLQEAATPGGYRPGVIKGVSRSVVVVYSARDWFAAYYAPLALRRPSFEGMASPDVWAGAGQGFATMGGVGPKGLEVPPTFLPLIAPGTAPQGPLRYELPRDDANPPGPTIVAVDGASAIWAHGDANDRTTWWMLANQVEGGKR